MLLALFTSLIFALMETMVSDTVGVLPWIFTSAHSTVENKSGNKPLSLESVLDGKLWKLSISLSCDFEYTFKNVLKIFLKKNEMGSCIPKYSDCFGKKHLCGYMSFDLN